MRDLRGSMTIQIGGYREAVLAHHLGVAPSHPLKISIKSTPIEICLQTRNIQTEYFPMASGFPNQILIESFPHPLLPKPPSHWHQVPTEMFPSNNFHSSLIVNGQTSALNLVSLLLFLHQIDKKTDEKKYSQRFLWSRGERRRNSTSLIAALE